MSCLSIAATGDNITTSGTSANIALPVNSAGGVPTFVRVAATVAAHVRLGTSGSVAATTDDILVMPNDAVVLLSRGFSHIAAIQNAAAGLVQVSPVEDVIR
jgi:hypothetical protein